MTVIAKSPISTEKERLNSWKIVQTHRCAWNYFFLILAHSVYKMWIKQEPNMLELWNKLHFEEKETESVSFIST